VTEPTSLLVLHEHAGGVDAEVGLLERVIAHRRDERLHELGERAVPAAHRGARELDAVTRVHPFEPMKRHVVLPSLHDRVREHARPGESARDRKECWLRDEDLGLGIALTILAYELRANNARHDEGGRTTLERFADVLSDALEGVEAALLDLGREQG
jgi:hypothetical protein